jgi:hypothetical protein
MNDITGQIVVFVGVGLGLIAIALVGGYAFGSRKKPKKPETPWPTVITEGDPRLTGRLFTPTRPAEPPATHTHTYKVNSEHTDQGRRVVVKKCVECGDVIREMD